MRSRPDNEIGLPDRLYWSGLSSRRIWGMRQILCAGAVLLSLSCGAASAYYVEITIDLNHLDKIDGPAPSGGGGGGVAGGANMPGRGGIGMAGMAGMAGLGGGSRGAIPQG